MKRLVLAFLIMLCWQSEAARAETGYDLWLRYRSVTGAEQARIADHATALVGPFPGETLAAGQAELSRALEAMLGHALPVADSPQADGAIVLGTPQSSAIVARFGAEIAALGSGGYLVRSATVDGRRVTVIAGRDDLGVLYGCFAWLRLVQIGAALDDLDLRSSPALQLRMLDHWDNLDGSVERGYAGRSIWDWWTLPEWKQQRYTDYARANASIGINGVVLNNVNASAEILTDRYVDKVAALAQVMRPYGIRVFVSARFSAPMEIGGLKTADPLDPAVRAWWKGRAEAIYARIPDFGGFLVKANSEGQPGPQDYGRTHAEGANMLAEAVAPHGGVVIWRAFVYARQTEDRAAQAFDEFKPLDGAFAANVILQVKNGPLDFQPREPVHPLFGAMPHTAMMLEVQATKEYLGFATHLAYLGPLFQEVLRFDTGRTGTVAQTLASPPKGGISGMAAVANIGTDVDWTGGAFNQANWYAAGRFAWNPAADSEAIAREWAAQTFSADPAFLDRVVPMMMASRQAVVDYTGPLGLTHQMQTGHHYGPGPWLGDHGTSVGSSLYFSKAGPDGIGFDRIRCGSCSIAQYAPRAQKFFANPASQNSDYLLWFHHKGWSDRIPGGGTVWNMLVKRYDRGVAQVASMQETWADLEPYVDADRFAQVRTFLTIQRQEAQWWRDASIAFFQSLSKRPLPAGHMPPPHDLEYYKSLSFPDVPGTGK